MPRQTRSIRPNAARPVDSHVLKFVSRVEQLQPRGRRNFDRYMRVIKKHVSFDGPKHAQWQKESAEDAVWDAEWNKRHGPVDGGARILGWSRNQAPVREASEGTVLHLEDVKL